MTEQVQPNNNQPSDEIDLGQLLQLIKKGFHSLGNFILRVFIYLRRNIFKLIGLVVLGLAISFGLNQIVSKKLKTDVIVRPNFESKDYLYDVVSEVSANLRSRNENFLSTMNVTAEDVKGFEVEVEAIKDEEVQTDDSVLNDMRYLEVLQNFQNESFVIDILRSELSEKSVINHKITFKYKDPKTGTVLVEKLMNYINTNEYFNELKAVYSKNAKSRIAQNNKLIQQVDQLVDNYSKALLAEKEKSGTGLVYMEKENTLNVPALLNLKDKLSKENEGKRLEVVQQSGVLSILNFGKTQEVKKSFFNQTYFLIPTLLLFGFFMISFFKYLERKAKEIE